MSTLTKVLIVLLSLSSIFLSGTMVTFVATSSNYKEAYEKQKSEIQILEAETALFDQRFAEKSAQMAQLVVALKSENQELKLQLSTSELAKRTAESERDDLDIKYKTISGVMASFDETIANANKSRDVIQSELRKALEDINNLNAELNESESNQYEKSVYIEKLDAQVKYLKEEKVSLEAKIAELAKGKPVTREKPVTVVKDFAMPAPAPATDVSLKGLVSEVSRDYVVISLGSADGVTTNTVFHISRGAEFICNVKITSVDTNKSAGVVDLKLLEPKVGDTANNEL